MNLLFVSSRTDLCAPDVLLCCSSFLQAKPTTEASPFIIVYHNKTRLISTNLPLCWEDLFNDFQDKCRHWPSQRCCCESDKVSTFLLVDRHRRWAANKHGCRALRAHDIISGLFHMTWQASCHHGEVIDMLYTQKIMYCHRHPVVF